MYFSHIPSVHHSSTHSCIHSFIHSFSRASGVHSRGARAQPSKSMRVYRRGKFRVHSRGSAPLQATQNASKTKGKKRQSQRKPSKAKKPSKDKSQKPRKHQKLKVTQTPGSEAKRPAKAKSQESDWKGPPLLENPSSGGPS